METGVSVIFRITDNCPKCGGELKYYDSVGRLVMTKYRRRYKITVKRYKCIQCGSVHRLIPNDIYPFKHYERELIDGVVERIIDSDTLGFEDYPCVLTMNRWLKIFHSLCLYFL